MYAVIRRYKFDPSRSEELDQKVRETLLPLIRQASGFVTYYWLNTGEGEGASLSVFQDKAGAEESVRIAADFVQQHLATMIGKPEIIQGEVKAHA
jgi:hypothetical protein